MLPHVLPMDSTSKLNHIPKAMGWSNRWIPNEQTRPMTNVQLGHQSSIPPAKPQRYTCHILPSVWSLVLAMRKPCSGYPWQVPSHKPLARCLAEMAADAVHERAKIRRRQAGAGIMMDKRGVGRWWCPWKLGKEKNMQNHRNSWIMNH